MRLWGIGGRTKVTTHTNFVAHLQATASFWTRTVQRFIARRNLENFQRLLSEQPDPPMRRFLESMILDTRRELAHLEAAITGASTDLLIGPSRVLALMRADWVADFRRSSKPRLAPI